MSIRDDVNEFVDRITESIEEREAEYDRAMIALEQEYENLRDDVMAGGEFGAVTEALIDALKTSPCPECQVLQAHTNWCRLGPAVIQAEINL